MIFSETQNVSSTEDDLGKLIYNHSQNCTFPLLIPPNIPDSIRPPIPAPSRPDSFPSVGNMNMLSPKLSPISCHRLVSARKCLDCPLVRSFWLRNSDRNPLDFSTCSWLGQTTPSQTDSETGIRSADSSSTAPPSSCPATDPALRPSSTSHPTLFVHLDPAKLFHVSLLSPESDSAPRVPSPPPYPDTSRTYCAPVTSDLSFTRAKWITNL